MNLPDRSKRVAPRVTVRYELYQRYVRFWVYALVANKFLEHPIDRASVQGITELADHVVEKATERVKDFIVYD